MADNSTSKRWTMLEDLLLLEGMLKHSKKWNLVKEHMETIGHVDARAESSLVNRWKNLSKVYCKCDFKIHYL
jgi:hypothetical protein